MGNCTIFYMFENPRRGRQARNFTTNVPKILDLKSSSEQIFSKIDFGFFTMSSALNTPSRFKLTGNSIGKGGQESRLREIMHDSRCKIVDIWSFRPQVYWPDVYLSFFKPQKKA